MNILKYIFSLLLLLALPAGHLYSQESPTDSLHLRFSFKSGSACFMRNFHDNESMLEKAKAFMYLHRDTIPDGAAVTFHIYGYCGNGGTATQRRQRVKRMSNYVKGEFIHSHLVEEKHFNTQNSIQPYNSESPNTVILKCFASLPKQQPTPVVAHSPEQIAPPQQEEEPSPETVSPSPSIPIEPTSPAQVTEESRKPLFAIKTNLLFDAVSAVNVEVEVPVTNRWSVLGEWVFPWWTFDNDKSDSRRHRFQLLNFNLEGRYWLGNRNTHAPLTGYFGGLYAGAGLFDFEWDRKGYQGEFFIAAGISGGYAHSISRNLRLEYSLGIGYMKIRYKSYNAIYGTDQRWHAMRKENGRQSWLGPTRAKVSLVWMINNPWGRTKKGGAR